MAGGKKGVKRRAKTFGNRTNNKRSRVSTITTSSEIGEETPSNSRSNGTVQTTRRSASRSSSSSSSSSDSGSSYCSSSTSTSSAPTTIRSSAPTTRSSSMATRSSSTTATSTRTESSSRATGPTSTTGRSRYVASRIENTQVRIQLPHISEGLQNLTFGTLPNLATSNNHLSRPVARFRTQAPGLRSFGNAHDNLPSFTAPTKTTIRSSAPTTRSSSMATRSSSTTATSTRTGSSYRTTGPTSTTGRSRYVASRIEDTQVRIQLPQISEGLQNQTFGTLPNLATSNNHLSRPVARFRTQAPGLRSFENAHNNLPSFTSIQSASTSSSSQQTLNTTTTNPIIGGVEGNLSLRLTSRRTEGIPQPGTQNASTSSNGLTNAPNPIPGNTQNGITSAKLSELLKESSDEDKTIIMLLVDCRVPASYSKKMINFPNVVNVTPFDFDKNSNQELTSKAAVIKLLQGKCPELLEKLHEPGHYDQIILLDETSTTNLTSPSLKILRLAMIKWNETKKTGIKLLQGGMWAFSRQNPDLIILKPAKGLRLSRVASIQITKKTASPEAKVLLEGLKAYMENLDKVISVTKTLISLRQTRKSFDSVKSVLSEEHELKLLKILEALIPAEVRCPVCFEVYSGEIMQCGLGHCVCGTCVEKMVKCPECRLSYEKVDKSVGKVRNRVLEGLLENSMRCECPCGKVLMCKDAQSHAKTCSSENESEEIGTIEIQICLNEKEIKEENLKLEQYRKLINDSEQQWNNRLGSRKQDMIPSVECKTIMEQIYKKKVLLSSLNVSLLSSVFYN